MCNLVTFAAVYIVFYTIPGETHSACKQISLYEVDCSRKVTRNLLFEIPDDLNNEILSIDMTGQYLEKLPANAFSNLRNLSEISFDDCHIKSIDKDVFKNFHNLLVLSLKYNELSSLDDQLFQSNGKLQRIWLSYNEIQYISDRLFVNLTNLNKIDLSHNRISAINENAFVTNVAMEFLYLSFNLLTHMDTKTIKHLKGLLVGGNPWICDCNLKELRVLVVEKFLKYNNPLPRCQSPRIYKGVSWDQINSTEFICGVNVTSVLHVPRDITVNDNVILKCAVRGYPEPNVRFTFKNKIIDIKNHSKYLLHNSLKYHGAYWHNLTILNVKPQDTGLYKCVAKNSYGTDDMVTTLDVQYSSPFVTIYPPDSVLTEVENSVNVTISCNARGIPKPNIHWIHKGDIITGNVSTRDLIQNKQMYVVKDEENGWLNITFARIQRVDDGEYKCVGSNAINTSEHYIRLHVKPAQRPEMVTLLQSEVMNESMNVTLSCRVTAVPKAMVKWRRIYKNKTIYTNNRMHVIKSFVSSNSMQWCNLTIINLLVEDSGVYQCFASNSAGEQLQNVILKVNGIVKTWAFVAGITFGCIIFLSMITVIILKCCIRYHLGHTL